MRRRSPGKVSRGSREVGRPGWIGRRVTVPATHAARGFSDLLNRVEFRGESFVIERGGQAVCEVSPVRPATSTLADLVSLLGTLPSVDQEYLDTVETLLRDQASLPPSPWDS
jgi:antitoxin (DNA-binding transcriptional repressor) of toxin-antitoxin stability system